MAQETGKFTTILKSLKTDTLKKYLYLAILVFPASCGQINSKSNNDEFTSVVTPSNSNQGTSSKNYILKEQSLTFFSRDTNSAIVINEHFCKTITEPERAALGYVATFIGNECNWEGEVAADRSNLKCRILTALNLGYQCSEKHLGFLRQMFKNDTQVLEQLKTENCPTIPDGATIQETFDEITLRIKGNEILVFFKASGINMREGVSWSWTETDHFKFDRDNIKLVKKDVSKSKREYFDNGE